MIDVYINTYDKSATVYGFNVEPSTTVKQLKEYLRAKTNDDERNLEKMWLIFDNDILDDNEATISSYGVEDQSILSLHNPLGTSRNIGFVGMRFADVNNNKGLKRCQWSKTAPCWRRARCGLCLEGKCTNKDCEAKDHMVIIPIGYEKFDVLLDCDEKTTRCPVCKKYVQPVTCGLNNCWWRFDGRKVSNSGTGDAPVNCKSDWVEVDDAYHYFDLTTSEAVTWLKLILEARKTKPPT